jgi:3-hydroxy-9,10-secoandrosta-1,3,5(10)-triene-9,17-dione monooxygenase
MPTPSFSNISHDEAVERARNLVPVLRERVQLGEEARIMLPETIADLHRTGVLRALQPKRWGGMELDFVACFDICYELGRGCASTAWTGANLLIHHWMLGLYDEQAQAEVWGDDPEAFIASGVAVAQGKARIVEGGYILSGRWNFSSGVTVSDWNMLAATVHDGNEVVDYRLCLLHKSQYQVVDDWQVLGMRSTGSMTVVAQDIFVPEHRALCYFHTRGGGEHPGGRTNPGPLFRVALSMLSGHVIASAVVGNAQAALELTIEAVKPRGAGQAVQTRIGAAAAKIEAARHLLRADMIEGQEIANAGAVPSQERKLRAKRNCSLGINLSTEAVDALYAAAGAHGLYDGFPIQRIFRDAHAGAGHVQFRDDINYPTWGLLALGGAVENNLL